MCEGLWKLTTACWAQRITKRPPIEHVVRALFVIVNTIGARELRLQRLAVQPTVNLKIQERTEAHLDDFNYKMAPANDKTRKEVLSLPQRDSVRLICVRCLHLTPDIPYSQSGPLSAVQTKLLSYIDDGIPDNQSVSTRIDHIPPTSSQAVVDVLWEVSIG